MTGQKGRRVGFESPRELLLVEVVRRCRACGEQARLGLTKREARDYSGFDCEICESRNDDELSERDIPEWWGELCDAGPDSSRGALRYEHKDGEGPDAEGL